LEKEILEIVSLKKESLKNDKLERDRERDWRFQWLCEGAMCKRK